MPRLQIRVRWRGNFRDRTEERDFLQRVQNAVENRITNIADDYERVSSFVINVSQIKSEGDRDDAE